MNIGFDFDGVLRGTGFGLYRLAMKKQMPEIAQIQGAASNPPLVNPCLWLMPEDKAYCISHCAPGTRADEKREWLRHFYGDRIKLVPIEMTNHDDKAVATEKLKKCIELGIGVYIDDNGAIVRHMRKLIDEHPFQPRIMVLHYGSWVTCIGQ